MSEAHERICKSCMLVFETSFDHRDSDREDVAYVYCPRCSSHNTHPKSMVDTLKNQGKLEKVHPQLVGKI